MAVNLRLGQAHHSLGEYSRAREYLRKNVELIGDELLHDRTDMLGLPSVLSRAWLAMCLAEQGEFAEGLAVGEEALQIAETGDPGVQPRRRVRRPRNGPVLQGDVERAASILDRGLRTDPGEPIGRAWPFVASALGAAYTDSGAWTTPCHSSSKRWSGRSP